MKWFSISGIAKETKRIRWPKPKEIVKDCTTVVTFILVFVLFFYLCDLVSSGFLTIIGS